jgi:hypothetical protein
VPRLPLIAIPFLADAAISIIKDYRAENKPILDNFIDSPD